MSFLTSLPAASGKKRKGDPILGVPTPGTASGGGGSGSGGGGGGGGGGRKLEQRSIKQLQSQMRTVLSLAMETYLFPKDNGLGANLRKFMANYNDQKPDRPKKGEKGTGHPWGPARYGLYMTLVEFSLTAYKTNLAMKTEMAKAFPQLDVLIEGLGAVATSATAMIIANDCSNGFKTWQMFANHFESRETKDGRQVMHATPGKGFIMTDLAKENKIGTMDSEVIWTVLTYPLREFREGGTAPMNPNERGMQQLLN